MDEVKLKRLKRLEKLRSSYIEYICLLKNVFNSHSAQDLARLSSNSQYKDFVHDFIYSCGFSGDGFRRDYKRAISQLETEASAQTQPSYTEPLSPEHVKAVKSDLEHGVHPSEL